MFLDTDTSLTRSWRVDNLSSSPYTIEEIEGILIDEIYPVCRSNLFSIAGEWAGFDTDWLEKRVIKRLRSPFRRLHSLNLGRLTVPMSSEWRATRKDIVRRRRDQDNELPNQAL